MAENASTFTRVVASPVPRRRRWLIGAAGALGASGLVLGGVGVPVSAGGGNVAGNVHTSTEVEGGCASATAGTGGGEGSVETVASDQEGPRAAGHGTVTVSACRGDVDGLMPGDPDGSLPDEGDGIEPGDLGEVLPGGPGGIGGPGEPGGPITEVLGAVTEAVEDVPGGGDVPLPGDPAGGLPGLDGLVPAGPGTGPAGVLDRLAQIIPGVTGGAPGGDGGGAPGDDSGGGQGGNGGAAGNGGGAAVNTSAGGAVTAAVPGPGGDAAGGDPADSAFEAGFDGAVPGATLPRTGGGLGNGVPGLVALLGAGRAVVALVTRRCPAAGASQG